MYDYQVKVVVTKEKLPVIDRKNKINAFQRIFSDVASRYYRNRKQDKNLNGGE